jgi:hypothetical protein
MVMSVSEIIWCWWQISKWLWYIGRVILATDNWSTETDLSHWHWTTINTRQTDQRMNPGLCTDRVLPDYMFSLLLCVLINVMGLIQNHKFCLKTKLIPKINRTLAYPWLNCSLSIPWECKRTVMHYTAIVIRHSETGDLSCWEHVKVAFHPWWRTYKFRCIFTVFTGPHNNTILYRCDCWKFNFIFV